MRFHLDPTFRFHVRCALLIAMTTAFVTLFGALYWSVERMNELAISQEGFRAEAQLLQAQLGRRVGEMKAERAGDVAHVQEQLRKIGERQEASGGSATSGLHAPFAIEKVIGSVVELVCIDNTKKETYYTGSGTVVHSSGMIVTNRHVLVSADGSLIGYCGVGFTSDIQAPPKIEYIAQAVATREASDLALLVITEQIDGKKLPATFAAVDMTTARADSLALGIGDPIYIGGYPGLGADTFTFTQGVVSGRVGNELIKTSALIDSGASGGAAFNGNGSYVGIPTAAAKGDIGGSLGYIVGANVVDQFLADYAKKSAKP